MRDARAEDVIIWHCEKAAEGNGRFFECMLRRDAETGRKKEAERLIAGEDEIMEFYTAVLRGEMEETGEGKPTLANRMKAAEGLMKRYDAREADEKAGLCKLDRLLEGMKHAIGR